MNDDDFDRGDSIIYVDEYLSSGDWNITIMSGWYHQEGSDCLLGKNPCFIKSDLFLRCRDNHLNKRWIGSRGEPRRVEYIGDANELINIPDHRDMPNQRHLSEIAKDRFYEHVRTSE